MLMVDIAAVLRELAKEVKEQLGGKWVMFNVHESGMVSITAMNAEKEFHSFDETKAGDVMVYAHLPTKVEPKDGEVF